MEINQHQEVTKKVAIRRTVKILLGTVIFVLLGTYLMYGEIPKITFIVLLVFIPIFMVIPAILGFKYQKQINNPKSKFWYIYLGIGILMTIINLIIVFRKEATGTNYINIIIGLAIIFYSIKTPKSNL